MRILLGFGLLLLCSIAPAQVAPGKYLVVFSDKNNNSYSLENPEEYLSQRALERRKKYRIPLDESDLPVSRLYLDSLEKSGFEVLVTSKWFNSAVITSFDTLQIKKLADLSFIKNIPFLYGKEIRTCKKKVEKFIEHEYTSFVDTFSNDYGVAAWQIELQNGISLHQKGYLGKGLHIAVLDAGFTNAPDMPTLGHLFQNGQVLGTRDFVNPRSEFFSSHSHGTYVLSVMGGYWPSRYIGTSPEASYWLIRTEDAASEFIIEEENWIAGAEFADSAGADIINTSLGYTTFDFPFQNHTIEEMDGQSTRISIASNIAASKGMLLVTSAGNQGDDPWKYISAPADAPMILSVGAVGKDSLPASFSSYDVPATKEIKPDIAAAGKNTYAQRSDSTLARVNGTSLSSPVITGLAACLWQAFPEAANHDIIMAIKKSASHYLSPHPQMGYGIPDFDKAFTILEFEKFLNKKNIRVLVYPNPFTNKVIINTIVTNKWVEMNIFDLSGRIVFKDFFMANPGNYNEFEISGLENLTPGVYIVKIRDGDNSFTSKIFKF
ncbi:MAG: S8 family serine peptidase [Bacteroidota bacterium]